jgi:hypothetical protein
MDETDYGLPDTSATDDTAQTSFFEDFSNVLGQISNAAANAKSTAEDVRRATAYGSQQIAGAIQQGKSAPLDSKLNWFQNEWLYGGTTGRALIVAMGAVAAWFIYKEFA